MSITGSTPNYSTAKRRTAEEYTADTALPREDEHPDKDDMSKWTYHTHQPQGWCRVALNDETGRFEGHFAPKILPINMRRII